MFRAFFRFIFFIVVCILFFIWVHVINFTMKEYIIALAIGAISGLVLFIVYTILFPIKKKKRDKSSIRIKEERIRRDRSQLNHKKRNIEDTDKIRFDR